MYFDDCFVNIGILVDMFDEDVIHFLRCPNYVYIATLNTLLEAFMCISVNGHDCFTELGFSCRDVRDVISVLTDMYYKSIRCC